MKYDGYRGLLYVDHGRGRLISRNSREMKRFGSGLGVGAVGRGPKRDPRMNVSCARLQEMLWTTRWILNFVP